jgi:hypothetical protein
VNVASGSFSVTIKEDTFNMLIDYLTGIKGIKMVKDEDVNSGLGELFKFQSDIGDIITLTYFKVRGTLLYQGYLMKLYTEVKCFLNPFVKIDAKLSNISEFDGNDIEEKLKMLLPDAYGNIDRMLEEFIYDSIVQMVYRIPCKDYSVWAFSALKSLEGYMKQVFLSNSVRLNDKIGFTIRVPGEPKPKPIFITGSTAGSYVVDTRLVSITLPDTLSVLENCYTYFAGNRHMLFHTKQALNTTKTLRNSSEAADIIYRVCDLINSSYKLIKV